MEVYWLLYNTRAVYVYMDPYDSWGVRAVQRVQKENVVTGSGCHYNGFNPNDDSNDVVDLV